MLTIQTFQIIKNNKKTASESFEIGSVRMLKNKVSDKVWPSINNWVKKQNVLNKQTSSDITIQFEQHAWH